MVLFFLLYFRLDGGSGRRSGSLVWGPSEGRVPYGSNLPLSVVLPNQRILGDPWGPVYAAPRILRRAAPLDLVRAECVSNGAPRSLLVSAARPDFEGLRQQCSLLAACRLKNIF